MNDTELTAALHGARAGDQAAMVQLFRLLQPPLLRYLRHHAPAVAEDLASETWLAFAKALAGFDGDGPDARAWMFGVARRRLADHWRSQRRRSRLASLWVDDASTHPGPDAADEALSSLSAQSAVDALTRHLPPDQAEVILLRVIGGLTAEQVGALMGKSPAAVRVAQHRALRRLATIWEPRTVTQ